MSEAVTLVIEHRVKPECSGDYEAWVKEISSAARNAQGYEGVSIVRPHSTHTSYTIVVRFDSHDRLLEWLSSDVRKRLLACAEPYLLDAEGVEINTGLEFWFTPSTAKAIHAKPYKQFLITLSAIYPLTQLVPRLLEFAASVIGVPHLGLLEGLVTAAVIVFLMVYLIMPRYTRLAARWLFD